MEGAQGNMFRSTWFTTRPAQMHHLRARLVAFVALASPSVLRLVPVACGGEAPAISACSSALRVLRSFRLSVLAAAAAAPPDAGLSYSSSPSAAAGV